MTWLHFPENAPIDSLGHRPLEISDDKREAKWNRYCAVYGECPSDVRRGVNGETEVSLREMLEA